MQAPRFHFYAGKNWLNDPNGLCQVDGWYHLYYQYNPHAAVWGDMHWGHAHSRDLLHWEHRPIAMAPALALGEVHCFSGSCCLDAAGKPHFFYTSIGRQEDHRDAADGAEQWFAAPVHGDMDHLQQTREGALTDALHAPKHLRDWRDPYVIPWQGGYLMTVGAQLDDAGCIALYTSDDMQRWTYRGIALHHETPDGKAWECPNLFPLGDKMVLFYSPFAPARYAVGTLDAAFRFHVEREGVLDPGGHRGFYAPQTFRDTQGRQILLGWIPEDETRAAAGRTWRGMMSLPRILTLENGDLMVRPLDTIDTLAAHWESHTLAPGKHHLTANGQHVLLHAAFDHLTKPLCWTLLAGEKEQTTLTLTPTGELTLTLTHASLDPAYGKAPLTRHVSLREKHNEFFLAVDGTVVECMVNGQWLTGRAYPVCEDSGNLWVEAGDEVRVSMGGVREV